MTALGNITVLDRPIYGMSQVDALLRLANGTARRWIDGYERSGKHYPPVVRVAPTGDDVVTWGEFVETRLLAGYRDAGVPMVRMRPVVEQLRDQLGVPYPLAHERPFVAGRELVAAVQADVHLDQRLAIVEVLRTGQYALSYESRVFVDSIDWQADPARAEGTFAARLRPLGRGSPIFLDPLRSFGEPVIGAVRTDVIAEEVRAGEAVTSVAESFGISVGEVAAALHYEEMMTSAA
jgi:uncharacterized protein (DUF433 family)